MHNEYPCEYNTSTQNCLILPILPKERKKRKERAYSELKLHNKKHYDKLH